MGKGKLKSKINKFKSGVKSGFASVPAKKQTSNSGYSIGAYSSKPSTSKLQKSSGFYPTPTGKAPVAQSKYSIGGMKNAPQSSYLTNLSNQKKTTFPVKPATTFGGQTLVPGKPVGGQTKVPLNYTPVPGISGPQTLVPRNTGGSSGGSSSQFGSSSIGRPAQVNGAVDAVDTVVDKGATQTFSGGGETATARTGTTTAPAGSTATSGATTTGSGITLAPAGSEGYLGGYDYSLSNEERAQQEALKEEQAYYEKQKNERVDRNQIMRDALRQFQGEIDATNSVYADKLKQTQLAGLDRLGMSRAENFNAGAVNSSFGNAALDRVGAYNRDAEGAVNNEKLQLISSIESSARAAGDKYYQEKKAAKEAGLEAYMTSLGNAKTAKQAISADIANNMISSGVDFDSISPAQLEKIAKGAGVAVRSIKEEYDKSKLEADKGKIAASRENTIASLYNQGVTDPYQILNYVNYDDNGNQTGDITLDEITKVLDAQRESQFNLPKGQARFDQYGNIIASNYGTDSGSGYGSSISSTGGVSVSPAAQSYIDRYNSGSATFDDIMKSIPGVTGQGLRDEISMAIASQSGTLPDFARNKLTEAQSLVNELLLNSKGKRSAVGSSFGKLVGTGKRGLQPKRVGFETKAQQLAGILTLDNLGVLKGPLSDADREFIQVVSSGQNLNMSEADFDANLRRILAKLDVKLGVDSSGASPEDDALLAQFDL